MANKPLVLPRESVELVVLNITVDGQAVTDFDVAVAEVGERPTEFSPATVVESSAGYLTGSLEPGLYNIYARVVSDPEQVVIMAGVLSIV